MNSELDPYLPFAQLAYIIIVWNVVRFTIVERPLRAREKFQIVIAGVIVGHVLVRLIRNPSLTYFTEGTWLSITTKVTTGLLLILTILMIAHAIVFLITRRKYLR